MIFKKYWLIKEKRFMKINEILSSGFGRFHRTQEFKSAGVELIDNSENEIIDVNIEMKNRLEGTWVESEEDKSLQKNFWAHFKNSDLHGNFLGKIGSKFLKEDKSLFLN